MRTKVETTPSESNPLIYTTADELKKVSGVPGLIDSLYESIREHEISQNFNKAHLKRLRWLLDNIIENNCDENSARLVKSFMILDPEEEEIKKPSEPPVPFTKEQMKKIKEYESQLNKAHEERKKLASLIKPKSFDLNRELAFLGGVAPVLKSLNMAILELKEVSEDDNNSLDADIEVLHQLRQQLVLEYYGHETYSLVDLVQS